MKSAFKRGKSENNRIFSGHINTLHQRLYHALKLGFRCFDYKERKWQSTDIEIQRHAIRSIDAFLDCISAETVNHPVVKDSVADIFGALVVILQYKSDSILRPATDVVLKLLMTIPSLIDKPYVLDLLQPLTSLLSSHQVQVSISSASSLNLILSSLSIKREKQVFESLKDIDTVGHIVSNLRDFTGSDTMAVEYFNEMTSVLSTILGRWHPFRYTVWSDAEFMKVIEDICVKPDFNVHDATLKLYSALALCGSGAQKLLENGEALVQMMVRCMGSSQPHHIRVAGFQLAQCLAMSEQGCLKMMSFCCGPIVEAIICGMSGWSMCSGKVARDQISLLEEACRLALITRWEGEHHNHFWKLGIDRVLLRLLQGNLEENLLSQDSMSTEKLISIARETLNANILSSLRADVWDILGWLATHCEKDSDPIVSENKTYLDILISCACLAFMDTIRKGHQIGQDDNWILRSVSVSRAVMLMIYSHCKYIASRARFILSEVSKTNGKEHLKCILHNIDAKSSVNCITIVDTLQLVIDLISLTCYIGLPRYRRSLIKGEAIKTLLNFTRQCLSNDILMKRPSVASNMLHKIFDGKTCCHACTNNWEGMHVTLFYSLWGLAELINPSGSRRNNSEILFSDANHNEAYLVSMLQDICINIPTPGPRWYAAYILSFFGFYGFPNEIGKRIGTTLKEEKYADMQLIHRNGESFSVHGVILTVRCPSLLPPERTPSNEKISDRSFERNSIENLSEKFREVRLSDHVDNQALVKLLEFVYLGYLQAGDELVRKLKTLAKHCKLQQLNDMLCRRSPKWGTPFPRADLTLALDPAVQKFSDIILEAKSTERIVWKCKICSMSVPHMHVHKLILWSSCDYLRALFQSGMQESHSETIKVPVSWEAMVKLVAWFYSNELPFPPSGCLWANMNKEEQLYQLQPYLELCWLSDYWLLENVHEVCSQVVRSCLDSARHLSIKVIQIAANLNLWELATIAADYISPLYYQLRKSGELEALDEDLVDMVRAASVRCSQKEW